MAILRKLGVWGAVLAGVGVAGGVRMLEAQSPPSSPPIQVPDIPAEVGLGGLMSLSDGHLRKMADSLEILAASGEARSGDWERIRGPLQEVASRNVEALNWFALPDGSYWSVQEGREAGNLSDRPYFRNVMAGETVIGEMLVSRATGESVGIVAVPVRDEAGAVIGALGASIYLEKLSARLGEELNVDEETIYYSFDSTPTVGLDWDPALVLTNPDQLGKEVSDAFDRMLGRTEGVESYTFRGKRRIVLFRKSEVTGWWYAFGVVPGGRGPPGTTADNGGR